LDTGSIATSLSNLQSVARSPKFYTSLATRSAALAISQISSQANPATVIFIHCEAMDHEQLLQDDIASLLIGAKPNPTFGFPERTGIFLQVASVHHRWIESGDTLVFTKTARGFVAFFSSFSLILMDFSR
jgi:hypothetical protein